MIRTKIFFAFLSACFFIALYSNSSAQDLEVPKLIDLGVCPTGLSSYGSAIYPGQWLLINVSNKTIYLDNYVTRDDYPDSIRQRGNRFYIDLYYLVSLVDEFTIPPGDTLFVPFSYYSTYEDSISKSSYLKETLLYSYHIGNDTTDHWDSTEFRMRSLDKDSLLSFGMQGDINGCAFDKHISPYYVRSYIEIFNKTESSYIIDSLHYKVQGNMTVNGLILGYHYDRSLRRPLPFEIKKDSAIYLFASNPFPWVSKNKVVFDIFCHKKNAQELTLLRDSIISNILKPDPVELWHNYEAGIVNTHLGDSINYHSYIYTLLYINFCSDDSLVADSLVFHGDMGLNKFIIMPNQSVFDSVLNGSGLINFVAFKFIAREIGTKYGTFIAYFHDKNGKRYTRFSSLKITVDSALAGVSNIQSVNDGMLVYPNPANNFIYVKTNDYKSGLNKSIIIYNSLGVVVLKYKSGDDIPKIPLDNLSNGSYFLVIRSGSQNSFCPFMIRR